MSTLTDAIDELAEEAFWDGAEVDEISTAIMLSWLEAKGTQYSPDEIVAALHSVADVISKQTNH